MKDKEKQIEEMAKDITYLTLDREVFVSATNTKKVGWTLSEEGNKLISETLISKGWTKLPEDSIVISREEYNDLKGLEKKFDDYLIKEIIATRKETAEKILKLVFKHITTLEVWEVLQQNTWLSSVGNFTANKHIYDLLIEPVAKQFGEIKE